MSDDGSVLSVSNWTLQIADRVLLSNGRLEIGGGEIVGLAGRSGSGKTSLARSLVGLARGFAVRFEASLDQVRFDAVSAPTMRGAGLGYVAQEARASLDPTSTVREHFAWMRLRNGTPVAAVDIERSLHRCGLDELKRVLDSHPHALSGGECMRVAMALALSIEPRVLILDEPTASLDALTSAEIAALLRELSAGGSGIFVISHDAKFLSATCDSVLEIVDRDLRPMSPRIESKPSRPAPTVGETVLISARGIHRAYKGARVLDGVDLDLSAGARLGIVGRSGSGKSTLGRILSGLDAPTSGRLTGLDRDRRQRARKVQLVFQDPGLALHPLFTVERLLCEPGEIHELEVDVASLMAKLELDPELLSRFPRELSTGQKQRVALARALAVRPKVLILDEPTAALDAELRQDVLRVVDSFVQQMHSTLVLMTHDEDALWLVDRVYALRAGRLEPVS